MQRLSQGRLIGLLPQASELWLDGGHNPDGSRAIANALADIEERVSRPLVLIVGMLASKDAEAFLRNFSGLARYLVAVPIPDQKNSVPAETIASIAQATGIPAKSSADVESALAEVEKLALASPAPGADHRLALPRRRRAGGERHAAGIRIIAGAS